MRQKFGDQVFNVQVVLMPRATGWYCYQVMIDHRSYTNNLNSCESESWRKYIQAWIYFFFRLQFYDCLHCLYNCDAQSWLHIFLFGSNIWSFIYSFAILLSLETRKAPCGSLASYSTDNRSLKKFVIFWSFLLN